MTESLNMSFEPLSDLKRGKIYFTVSKKIRIQLQEDSLKALKVNRNVCYNIRNQSVTITTLQVVFVRQTQSLVS